MVYSTFLAAVSRSLSLHTTSAGETYGLLNCGPEYDAGAVVGVPIHKALSGTALDEYLRPQGRFSVLIPKAERSSMSTERIRIQTERQSKVRETMGQRLWLRVEGHQRIKLKLEECYPPGVRWEKGRALIAEASDSDRQISGRYLTRFRSRGEGSPDVKVVLEFERLGSRPRARCHVMTLSRGIALDDLLQSLTYMRPVALGNQGASVDNLHMEVTVEGKHVEQEPVLVTRLALASSSPEGSVNADLELDQVKLKLELMRILQPVQAFAQWKRRQD